MKSLRESLLRSVNESGMSQLERELKSYKLKNRARINIKDFAFDYDAQKDMTHQIKNWPQMVKDGNKVMAIGLMKLDQWFKPGVDWEISGDWDEENKDFVVSTKNGELHFESYDGATITVNGQDATDVCMPMNGDKSDPLYNDYGWESTWLIDCYMTFLKRK